LKRICLGSTAGIKQQRRGENLPFLAPMIMAKKMITLTDKMGEVGHLTGMQ